MNDKAPDNPEAKTKTVLGSKRPHGGACGGRGEFSSREAARVIVRTARAFVVAAGVVLAWSAGAAAAASIGASAEGPRVQTQLVLGNAFVKPGLVDALIPQKIIAYCENKAGLRVLPFKGRVVINTTKNSNVKFSAFHTQIQQMLSNIIVVKISYNNATIFLPRKKTHVQACSFFTNFIGKFDLLTFKRVNVSQDAASDVHLDLQSRGFARVFKENTKTRVDSRRVPDKRVVGFVTGDGDPRPLIDDERFPAQPVSLDRGLGGTGGDVHAVGGGLDRLAGFPKGPPDKTGGEEREEERGPGCRNLFFGGVRSPYLSVQIFGVMLVGLGFAALVVVGLVNAVDGGTRRRRRLGWALAAACTPVGLTFYGWGGTGHPLTFWGLCGYLSASENERYYALLARLLGGPRLATTAPPTPSPGGTR